MRRNFDRLSGVGQNVLKARYPQIQFENRNIGGVATESLSTTEGDCPTFLYFHGGGYFMGSIHSYRRMALRLAFRTKTKVVSVDYRRAPEAPYPAALEDALAVYLALEKEVGHENLFVGGDSAGGGLTLALLLKLRDDGRKLPARAFLLSAWTDLLGTGESNRTNRNKEGWLTTGKHNELWAPLYYGKHDAKHPYISPVYGSFRGLPPLLFMVGDQEVLLDDTLRIYEKARQEGVRAELHLGIGMQHVWPYTVPFLKESKEAMKRLDRFLKS